MAKIIQRGRAAFEKRMAEWLGRERTHRQMVTEPQAEIEPSLGKSTLEFTDRMGLPASMQSMASYFGAEGALRCFTDPVVGWPLIRKGLLYYYWLCRLRCHGRQFWKVRRGQKREAFTHVANLANQAALGLALCPDEAFWMLDVMERGLSEDEPDVWWGGDDYYSAYLVRLYRMLQGRDDGPVVPPDADPWETPYPAVFEHWNDEAKLAETIHQMCEYHLYWNYDETEDHDSEFDDHFAGVNPVEIHALEYVRTQLGLSTPRVEHELLQPPFYPIPDSAKNITEAEILEEDDLLRRIVEANRDWLEGDEM